MSKLTAKSRNKLPKSDFALPGSRKYLIQDKSHAANAKARAEQMENKGKISASPEITYLESILTQDVIDAWRGLQQ